ncbi:hypothetical protein EPO15_15005 [bacterium]|nr:MAG: hypothetical protein EPO15_15005 [bacterium]
MGVLLALAVAVLAGPVHAEDLTAPEAFGRYADSSRIHADATAVPLGAVFAAPHAGHSAALTAPSSAHRYPSLSPVPAPTRGMSAPPVARTSAPERSRRAGQTAKGLILVAAGGLLLWGLRPEKAQTTRSVVTTWTPPPTWRREWPAGTGPTSLPTLRLPAPDALPTRPPSWWGITDAERDAIARWDASAEKERAKMPLDRWLDAHQAELRDVNVWRLKEKLWRDA